VLTNTVSTDGSVGGIYHATVQLAQRTADSASKSSAFPNGMKKLEGSVDDWMGGEKAAENKNQNQANQNNGSQNTQSKQKDNSSQQKNR